MPELPLRHTVLFPFPFRFKVQFRRFVHSSILMHSVALMIATLETKIKRICL
jgi:hypothetical protein